MAAFNFPNSPSTNDLHTENGVTFKWNGTIWLRIANSYSDISTLNVSGISTFGGDLSISDTIVHTGDTNTKLRFPSADTFTAETAGNERLRITSAGKIGIGEVAPTNMLHVKAGDTGVSSFDSRYHITVENNGESYLAFFAPDNSFAGVRFHDTTGTEGYIDYYFNTDEMHYYSSAIHKWTANGSERLRIDSSGNIGAGTNSPSSFSASDFVISKSANAGITISVGNAGTTNTASIFFAEGTGGTGDKERGAIKYKHGDDYLAFHTNYDERLRINKYGGVGIRTDLTTSYGFCIAGASGAAGASLHDSGGLILQPTDAFFASGRIYPAIMWSGNTNSLNRARAGITAMAANSNDASHLIFMTRHAANGTSLTTDDERMRIADDGVVQVGKDNQSSTTYTQQMYIRGRYVNAEGDFAKLLFRNSTDSGSCSAGIRGRRDAASNYATGLTFHTNQGNNNTTDGGQGRKTMHISSEGWVTMPYQSCFQAHSNGASHIDIPSNASNDYVFTTESFDNHNDYNTSNGRFTAPVAGKYVFGIQIYAGFSIGGVRVQHARFRKNGGDEYGTDIFGGASNHGGTSYHPTGTGSVMYNLAANDYVTWNIGTFAGSGSGSSQIYGSKSTRFWGYLVA